jgi:hypothetical protein
VLFTAAFFAGAFLAVPEDLLEDFFVAITCPSRLINRAVGSHRVFGAAKLSDSRRGC